MSSPHPETWCIFGVDYPRVRGGGYPRMVTLLMNEKGWPQTGLARFEMIFVHRGDYAPYHRSDGIIVTDGSTGESARWEEYLASLPQHRFERKKARLRVVLRGFPALDFCGTDQLNSATVARFKLAVGMVRQGLTYAQSKLKTADGIDLSPLLTSLEEVALRDWDSDKALRVDLTKADVIDRARIDAIDPWQKIDLRGFHPKARAILDDPADWSGVHDFSPHGNDLGADILGSWSQISNQSPEKIAERYELDLNDPSGVGAIDRIQLMLALAFGHVKKTGTCPADLALRARATLIRDFELATGCIATENQVVWQGSCERYAGILSRFCPSET